MRERAANLHLTRHWNARAFYLIMVVVVVVVVVVAAIVVTVVVVVVYRGKSLVHFDLVSLYIYFSHFLAACFLYKQQQQQQQQHGFLSKRDDNNYNTLIFVLSCRNKYKKQVSAWRKLEKD